MEPEFVDELVPEELELPEVSVEVDVELVPVVAWRTGWLDADADDEADREDVVDGDEVVPVGCEVVAVAAGTAAAKPAVTAAPRPSAE